MEKKSNKIIFNLSELNSLTKEEQSLKIGEAIATLLGNESNVKIEYINKVLALLGNNSNNSKSFLVDNLVAKKNDKELILCFNKRFFVLLFVILGLLLLGGAFGRNLPRQAVVDK